MGLVGKKAIMSTVVDNYLSVVDNMILRLFWGGIIEVKYGL